MREPGAKISEMGAGLRVRRYQRAYASGAADIGGIAEILNELPLLIEAPIVDEQRKIAIDLRR